MAERSAAQPPSATLRGISGNAWQVTLAQDSEENKTQGGARIQIFRVKRDMGMSPYAIDVSILPIYLRRALCNIKGDLD